MENNNINNVDNKNNDKNILINFKEETKNQNGLQYLKKNNEITTKKFNKFVDKFEKSDFTEHAKSINQIKLKNFNRNGNDHKKHIKTLKIQKTKNDKSKNKDNKGYTRTQIKKKFFHF